MECSVLDWITLVPYLGNMISHVDNTKMCLVCYYKYQFDFSCWPASHIHLLLSVHAAAGGGHCAGIRYL